MNDRSDLASATVASFPDLGSEPRTLSIVMCGPVDSGKSTLSDHLLSQREQAIERQSGRAESTILAEPIADHFATEREQRGATENIYRFFSTGKRHFAIADAPGDGRYIWDVVTAASAADIAVIVVDARTAIDEKTRFHSQIVSLMGAKHIVLAINKVDLVQDGQARFKEIEADFRKFAQSFGSLQSLVAIPLSASSGANVVETSKVAPWYKGPTLLQHLEGLPIERDEQKAFRMPVRHVQMGGQGYPRITGTIVSGETSPGDAVRVLPSGKSAKVEKLLSGDDELDAAQTGQSVALTLDRGIDNSSGGVIVQANAPCEVADQFEVNILWADDNEMFPGRQYDLKCGTRTVPASITRIKHRLDINTFAELAAERLQLNHIGRCTISTLEPIAFEPFETNRSMGSFILIDRITKETVGLGVIDFALRRSSNIHRQDTKIDRQQRSVMKKHRSVVLWFTGLSGSGKSTIADLVEQQLVKRDVHTMILDGDNVRHGLNRDLGFTDTDRVENIRRISEVSKLFFDAGVVTLVSFISPFRDERRMARQTIGDEHFLEIHVNTPLEIAEQRDVKGLYAKARAGEIKNFTGIDSPYEEPENAELTLDTSQLSEKEAAGKVIKLLERRGFIK